MQTALERGRATLDGFERIELELNGIRTVVHARGTGAPVVFLHGGGTFTGFDYLRGWTTTHRVIVPYHPGFGESADDPRIDSMQDYVLHYLDLFDALGLGALSLVGYSFGGWMAAEIALVQQERLRKLALVAPAGLVVRDPPAIDLLSLPPSEVMAHLTARPERLKPYLPEGHDLPFLTLRYRETKATARITWDRPSGNPKLERWLHRIRTPTLLVWGGADRVRPPAHGEAWARLLPDAALSIYEGAGHLVLEEESAASAEIGAFLAA